MSVAQTIPVITPHTRWNISRSFTAKSDVTLGGTGRECLALTISLEAADFLPRHVPILLIHAPLTQNAPKFRSLSHRVGQSANHHFFPTHCKPFAATAIFSAIRPPLRSTSSSRASQTLGGLRTDADARASDFSSDRRSAARLAVARLTFRSNRPCNERDYRPNYG